jgi:hypothetical protein
MKGLIFIALILCFAMLLQMNELISMFIVVALLYKYSCDIYRDNKMNIAVYEVGSYSLLMNVENSQKLLCPCCSKNKKKEI